MRGPRRRESTARPEARTRPLAILLILAAAVQACGDGTTSGSSGNTGGVASTTSGTAGTGAGGAGASTTGGSTTGGGGSGGTTTGGAGSGGMGGMSTGGTGGMGGMSTGGMGGMSTGGTGGMNTGGLGGMGTGGMSTGGLGGMGTGGLGGMGTGGSVGEGGKWMPPPPVVVPPLPPPPDYSNYPVDDQGRTIVYAGPGINWVIPAMPDAMTARDMCADLVANCYEPGVRSIDACMMSAPHCVSQTPWTEPAPCCADACFTAYAALRTAKVDPRTAYFKVLYDTPICMPGVDTMLAGGVP